jgi:asparagine synthase (glutamine-hydrolysing)
MCGISALITLDGAGATEAEVRAMTAAVRHRGPDDEGFALFRDDREPVLFGGVDTPESVLAATFPYSPTVRNGAPVQGPVRVALGHRRLSILDLSPAGHQPMCTPDRRYWIVYNGEVYNYRELRTELEAAGHTFRTGTDTEVILHSYAEWGQDCLDLFNGMFAFVIYDSAEQRIFAARDRFGVKPLYYWFSPDGVLAFASEIKQFTVLPGWEARLNHQRAFDYLAYSLLDHTDETMFAGVRQLRGGEAVEVAVDAVQDPLPVYRWYEFDLAGSPRQYDEACARFREIFTDAVRLRLRADVPIGSCLSGGLDSSSIVCVANDLLTAAGKEEVQLTFSATSDVQRFDESDYIRAVVEGREIEAHYVCPAIDDLLAELDRIIWHQDEPFGSTSIYAQWSVFRLAAHAGVKVMLDGQGADEQLCGYHSFFPVRYADLFRVGRWGQLHREIETASALFDYPQGHAATEMAFFLLPDRIRRPIQHWRFGEMLTPSWIDTSVLACPHRIYDVLPPTHSVRDQSHNQLFFSSLPMLLHWEDRDSMAHSIESRVPFLDYRVVEFVLSLPTDYKLSNCRTKMVLRDAMEHVLPGAIRDRQDKMGFVTAEVDWIRNRDPDLFRRMVGEAIVTSKGILNDSLWDRLESVISGEDAYLNDWFVWRGICFGRWMALFNVEL